jgi:hypothetical protein
MPSPEDLKLLEMAKKDSRDALLVHLTVDVLRAIRVAKPQYTAVQATLLD